MFQDLKIKIILPPHRPSETFFSMKNWRIITFDADKQFEKQ